MSKSSSRQEAIGKIVDKLQALGPTIHTEGLFVKLPLTDLSYLILWDELTLDQLDRVKVELRRGNDFTVGERHFVDVAQTLATVIGIAFATDELLPKYGLVMDPTGRISPLQK